MYEGSLRRLRGVKGVKGGLLDPFGALFAPLKAFYCTKFGSKHHIMVQLANVYKAGINDPFLSDPGVPGSSSFSVFDKKNQLGKLPKKEIFYEQDQLCEMNSVELCKCFQFLQIFCNAAPNIELISITFAFCSL